MRKAKCWWIWDKSQRKSKGRTVWFKQDLSLVKQLVHTNALQFKVKMVLIWPEVFHSCHSLKRGGRRLSVSRTWVGAKLWVQKQLYPTEALQNPFSLGFGPLFKCGDSTPLTDTRTRVLVVVGQNVPVHKSQWGETIFTGEKKNYWQLWDIDKFPFPSLCLSKHDSSCSGTKNRGLPSDTGRVSGRTICYLPYI